MLEGIKGRVSFSEIARIRYGTREVNHEILELSRLGKKAEDEVADALVKEEGPTCLEKLKLDKFERGHRLKAILPGRGVTLSAKPDFLFTGQVTVAREARFVEMKNRSHPADADIVQAAIAIVAAQGDREMRMYSLSYRLYYHGSDSLFIVDQRIGLELEVVINNLCLAAVAILGGQSQLNLQQKLNQSSPFRPVQGIMFALDKMMAANLSINSRNLFDESFDKIVAQANNFMYEDFH